MILYTIKNEKTAHIIYRDVKIQYVNVLYLKKRDVDLICNEESKLLNLEINKIIKNDVICGNFIICGQENGKSISLTEKQIMKYKRYFKERNHTIPN